MVEPCGSQLLSWRISCLALSMSAGVSAEGATHIGAATGNVAVWTDRERSSPAEQGQLLKPTRVGLQSGRRNVLWP